MNYKKAKAEVIAFDQQEIFMLWSDQSTITVDNNPWGVTACGKFHKANNGKWTWTCAYVTYNGVYHQSANFTVPH